MISESTKNQIRFTAKNKIRINYKQDVTLRESDYWNECDEVTVNQAEFNSLGIKYMHIKDPKLNKKNPYVCKEIRIFDERLVSFQQLYTDEIKCKIIGEPDIIEEIKMAKYYEEDNNWRRDLDYIRDWGKYDLNRIHRLEDIVINYEERAEELQRRIEYEERFMDKYDKIWFEENIKYIDLPTDIYNNVKKVAEKYGLSYDEVWYVWNRKKLKEINEIIENLNQQIDEFE